MADIESSTNAGMRRLPGPDPMTESDPFRSIKTSNGIPKTPTINPHTECLNLSS